MPGWVVICVVSTILSAPSSGGQSDVDESDFHELRGLKIVIPEATGKTSWGTKALTKTLRKTMSAPLGGLVSSKTMSAKGSRSRRSKKRAGAVSASEMARRAQSTNAEYVLMVDVTREGWKYTARAQLIRVDDGALKMDFRSQYFKPSHDAGDRGERIARRALQQLLEIRQQEAPEGVAQGGSGGSSFDSSDSNRSSPNFASTSASSPESGSGGNSGSGSSFGAPRAIEPSPFAASNSQPTSERKPWEAATAPAPGAETSRPPASSEASSSHDFLNASVGGGAGVLRRYELGTASGLSSLSYQLVGLGLVTVDADLTPPGFPFGLHLDGAWRPVRYEIAVPNESVVNAKGSLLDFSALVIMPLRLSGQGRLAYRLNPGIGLRANIANVGVHRGNRILSSRGFSLIAGAELTLPINELFDVSVGLDAGYVISYSESPTTNGDPDGGILIGGDLSFRIWLADAVGIDIDTRFDHQRLKFNGQGTRQIPENMGELIDASLNTTDVNVSVGVVLRF